MDEISSLEFTQLYINGEIPGTCKLYALQTTEAAIHLYETIDNCIDLINTNGGFTVTGWFKRGFINDRRLLAPHNNNNNGANSNFNNNNNNEDMIQVGAGEISSHVVNLIPTNR